MKTFKRILKESFVTASLNTSTKNTVEVFVNPDVKEQRETLKDDIVRFILDIENKKIYTWNGEHKIHHSIIKQLQKENILPIFAYPTNTEHNKYFMGSFTKAGGVGSDVITSDIESAIEDNNKKWIKTLKTQLNILLKEDFNWIDKYGISSNLINSYIKQQLEKL